ncbi:glycoside hydrolase family 2 sugar binding [Beutenbergia cavernae DSM 12333]|uniref:Glycoside hydrolase family 2 sugar binding n=1 Tax=Beutenbergia cavernae (strain ATCC BAA-8 / DSM 12333 / CCUG 43141 / JCM 11478 / NBRC 16432 / NCIMB 13614 / HKI 0122) TaxID=471853 RepID=C5C3E8_BEUC1|nr:DUF2804 family protein [Beutenbergia cavernae]ACQ79847.1 glycoside hydrolase family 2 sugar binding [Beutenbergia cavernae DSM 12333]
MRTPWGESLDPENVLPQYPRPQLVRDSYLNLNGRWEHAFTAAHRWGHPEDWDGEILVPFSPEAPLSGVGRTLQPDEALWYRRIVTVPADFVRERLLLHFGAVDQDCEVWVDGAPVGGHRGGYLPFALDVTDAWADGEHHEIVVRVHDVTDTSHRSRGKQRLERGGIWYTPQSGIWQTVWLESVPRRWVQRLELTPHLQDGEVEVTVVPGGVTDDDAAAHVRVSAGGNELVARDVPVGVPTRLALGDAIRRWSPEDPFLHDVVVEWAEDRVTSYVGMRSFGLGPDAHGRTRLLLNGEPYLHAGLLDQGYWPDGLYTAPSDEALVHDIRTAKDLGFTMLRKHIKVESLRWYHHCDRLGMLVWQDLVNGGRSYRPAVVTTPVALPVRLSDARYSLFGRQDAEGREEFAAELEATVELLRSVPSVAAWVPFNEGWGQFDARAAAARLGELDPTRPIDHASGWYDQGAGDVVSRHVYFRPYRLSRADAADPRAAVLSEYGGYSHRVAGHTWSDKEFGYRRYADRERFERAFLRLQHAQVGPAVDDGLAAFVYTQLADVEEETNGLMTYDRRLLKVDAEATRASNERLRHRLEVAAGGPARPVAVSEREITERVSLTRPDGRLNPDAVGWTRTPLHDTDGIGRGLVGRGRNKRWEYWAVTTPTHVIALVTSDIDYAAVHGIWLLDRATGEAVAHDAIGVGPRSASLPGTLGAGRVRSRTGAVKIAVDEVPGGTRLRAIGARVRVDVTAHRPEGHESLGVVVPWTDRLFQYTVKDVARPASGTVWIDGVAADVPASESWATLDHGRGRWPYAVSWNWGAGSGRTDGRVIGIQVGGRWTDGTGSVENALVVDGRLSKISEELVWDYDTADWMAPWRIHGERVDLTFTPFHLKRSVTDLRVFSSRTHQCFGHWSGRVRDDDGAWVRVADVVGWAEDVRNRW